MSAEINHRRGHLLDTTSMTMALTDQSSVTPIGASPTQSAEIRVASNGAPNRAPKADDTLYPAAVLAELSALVRSVRAISPESVLADIADAKIGRSLGRSGGDIPPKNEALRCAN